MAVPSIHAEMSGRVAGTRQEVFDFLREVDVTTVLTGYGPLPAVRSVSNPGGAWDRAGQERILHLSDGSSLRERLTHVDPPLSFAYDIDQITGPVRHLVRGFAGRWSCELEGEDAVTRARWHYVFEPRSWLTWPASMLVVRLLWQPYMGRVLERVSTALGR